MTTRKQIVLAVANGCLNTRQIAAYLDKPLSTINGYLHDMNDLVCFINGDLLQWSPTKTNTLRLGPLAAIVRGPDGQVKDVGRVADMNDLKASFNHVDLPLKYIVRRKEDNMDIIIEMNGFPSQKTTKKLLRIENGNAILEGYGCPEEHYRLSDGRRLDDKGDPAAWDIWRLSAEDRFRLTKIDRYIVRDLTQDRK